MLAMLTIDYVRNGESNMQFFIIETFKNQLKIFAFNQVLNVMIYQYACSQNRPARHFFEDTTDTDSSRRLL